MLANFLILSDNQLSSMAICMAEGNLGSLSNNDGDDWKTSLKKWIRAAWNLIALIPTRLILQTKTGKFFGIEF